MTQHYHFGRSSYRSELWIKSGAIFHRPTDINFEVENSGSFYFAVKDTSGNIVRREHFVNRGGWNALNFPSLGLYGDYRLGFINDSPGERVLVQGDVDYRD